MENRLRPLAPGDLSVEGVCRDDLAFPLGHQQPAPETWQAFVRVFTADSDDADRGWRCEYWGKMMLAPGRSTEAGPGGAGKSGG